MNTYNFAYSLEAEEDEIRFVFLKFPEIISHIKYSEYKSMSSRDREEYPLNAVISALQARIATKSSIPESDDPKTAIADGFVALSIQQAMKLELLKLHNTNNKSVVEFASKIGKQETAARRLLDLRHVSKVTEIEHAINCFGKTLTHSWELKPMLPSVNLRRAFLDFNF